jgi:hypothetical protein
MVTCFVKTFFVAIVINLNDKATIVEEICYTNEQKTEWSITYSIVQSNTKVRTVEIDDYDPLTNTTYVKLIKDSK